MGLEQLLEGCPECLYRYMKSIKALKFEETPNYDKLRKIFQEPTANASTKDSKQDSKEQFKFDWVVQKEKILAEKYKKEQEDIAY